MLLAQGHSHDLRLAVEELEGRGWTALDRGPEVLVGELVTDAGGVEAEVHRMAVTYPKLRFTLASASRLPSRSQIEWRAGKVVSRIAHGPLDYVPRPPGWESAWRSPEVWAMYFVAQRPAFYQAHPEVLEGKDVLP